MRIHVAVPKPTTVSVDDGLMALLGAALVLASPSLHADAKGQISRARHFVRKVAEQHGAQSSDGLSRAVQRAIFRCIANPQALAILDARDTEDAKVKAEAAHLEECAQKGWLTPAQVAEKRRQKELQAEGRKRRKERAAITAATTPNAKVSHDDLMRAGAAILSRPSVLLSGCKATTP